MSIKPVDLQNALPKAAEINRPREVQQQSGQNFQDLQAALLNRQVDLKQKKVMDPAQPQSTEVNRDGRQKGEARREEEKPGKGMKQKEKPKEGEKGQFLDVTL